ncbi:MAG: MBL fold metallo-hydrolase [Alicyclobacillus sp.]|nr:MBL fold metallo-hydrolase [Alicyclobacillus sp.]
MTPINLGQGVWLLDLFEEDRAWRTGSYVILDEQVTLIETGSARSHAALLAGLRALGLSPADLAYVVVTHVHLDHAGGAGALMAVAPHAQLLVHPRGARHMVDPVRLWTGARAVYGEQLEALFGSVQPVPAERVQAMQDGERLQLGRRELTFYDAPGHAKHHMVVLDPLADALYAGDALGIRYRSGYTGWPFEWVMPSTSPVDFDPEAVRRTVEKLRPLPFTWVYHTHFGPSPKAEALEQTLQGAEALAAWIRRVYRPDVQPPELISALYSWVAEDLQRRGHTPGSDLTVLATDVVLNALGLLHYERLRRERADQQP